jgi:TonB family protein
LAFAAHLLLLALAASGDLPDDGIDYGAFEDVSCREHAPRVKYPGKLRRAGLGGIVIYRVSVDAGNNYLGAVVHQSSGRPELDAAGMKVLPTWCFKAGREGGVRVAGDVLVPIRFTPRQSR